MKALTIRQPYATAIALGLKRFELRSGPPAGDLCPPGVRPLPGRAVNRGERIAIHAAATKPVWNPDGFGDFMVGRSFDGRTLHQLMTCGGSVRHDLPLGVILGTATLTNAYPVVERIGDVPDPRDGYIVRDGDALTLAPMTYLRPWSEYDLANQLPWAPWTPGQWAWELTDFTPTTERCPTCNGGGDFAGLVAGVHLAHYDCSTCGGAGSCPPIPVKGRTP